MREPRVPIQSLGPFEIQQNLNLIVIRSLLLRNQKWKFKQTHIASEHRWGRGVQQSNGHCSWMPGSPATINVTVWKKSNSLKILYLSHSFALVALLVVFDECVRCRLSKVCPMPYHWTQKYICYFFCEWLNNFVGLRIVTRYRITVANLPSWAMGNMPY